MTATSEAIIQAQIRNNATSFASGLANATGMSVGFALADNMINSNTRADITYKQGPKGSVEAGGPILVTADDSATIISRNTISAMSTTKNDGGLSLGSKLMIAYWDEYQFTSHSGTRTVKPDNMVRTDNGDIFQYDGNADATVDFTTAKDFAADPNWSKVHLGDVAGFMNNIGLNVTASNSTGAAGVVARNEIRGTVESYINNATVKAAGNVTVATTEAATVRATSTSTATSVGGSLLLSGSSNAVNGNFATNTVLTNANAYISGSNITTTAGGDVTVKADNIATITADINATSESKGLALGAAVAFNSIGFERQNILYNLAELLAGTTIVAAQPPASELHAYILNSTIHADGGVSITATSDSDIRANIGSASSAVKVTVVGVKSFSGGAVLALNKIRTDVEAFARDDGGSVTSSLTTQNDGILIRTQDASTIDSTLQASSSSVDVTGGTGFSLSVGLSVARNEIINDMEAFIQDVDQVTAKKGNVTVESAEDADIRSRSVASSISAAAGASTGKSFSGGGAVAVNIIRGKSNAFIKDSG